MSPFSRIVFLIASLSISCAALGACNTTEGFGKDVKQTGKSIEDKAKENK